MSQKILFIQYTNSAAFPPLEHSSRMFADVHWRVMFWSISSPGIESLRFPHHERVDFRQMPHCHPGWRQKIHYLQFSLWALWLAIRWRPNWIYASDLFSCPAALMLSFLPGAHVVYHEHDSPGTSTGSLFMTLNLAARRMLAKRAEICVLPNLRRAEIFDEIFDKDLAKSVSNGHRSSAVVWNCPSIEEVSKPRSAHDGGDLWVLYHGSIVPPRLPISVIEALALLPERVKLCVVGYETIGHPGYVDKLQKTADRLGLGRRVEFAGTLIDRQELLARCRKCDVGLALMPTTSEDINMQFMVGASNKPFDYLSCGLALLVSDLPDWKMAFVEAGYGLACDPDDSESIADALRFYLDHPDEMRSMGELGRLKIAGEWNYEIQFTPVLKRMCAASK